MNDANTDDDLRAELRDWLCAYLAEELRLPAGSIDPAEPMSAYGLDSVRAIALLTEVEDRVGFEIDPNALWEFPTVASFADMLAGSAPAAQSG
ncbi:acyl carrier protein [Actinomadura soli]|uniref:Acyl carrier protein n=1 Tax=Actinomadura soli TaxID=2508997 RepID=A0A5C4J8B3_9ACTN|nr:acyl carrier protein [Actinomadura soli]TMQ95629.1 acyl carrier protein [Actinomadura soli]